ncbi:hypothetical protein ACFOHU_01515 [Ottowia pentelensis]|uniref:Sigma-70 family RNA polymerase sigma factor n=1 Tax=Ottowia pentelensis TaxID=511108 RepID=A0ABV6PPB4_9BURK
MSADDSAVLARLWCRRQRMTPDDMALGYHLVQRALTDCVPPELSVLGESRQELVAQFIYLKVLRLAPSGNAGDEGQDEVRAVRSGHSAPSSSFALCAYFRRYVIDCTRAVAYRRRVPLGDSDELNDALLASQSAAPHTDDGRAALAEHGLTEAAVALAARRFIRDLPAAERLLLSEGFGQERPGGLAGVATRHAIASYHYRAGRLGLVHRRAALPADYRRTWLGAWIEQTLGIPIAAENRPVIGHVFQILAAEASWV